MTNRLFNRYLEKARKANVTPAGSKESINWFRRVVTRGGQITNHGKITEGLKVSSLKPGDMITYQYNPKLKEKLDFYDRHPLIIFLERTADGWYGLNLHYLPPAVRAQIFEELNYNEKRLPAIAQKLSKNKLTKPCLKRYLGSHVESKPKSIPKELWEIAIALPFDKFEKESKKTVWSLAKRRRNARNR